ncbi:MAG: cytochrome c [Chloroflexi bacterium]|nr:cytochrome c [Chloroflexota bacterium]
MKNRRLLLFMSLWLVLALALVGCGGDNGGNAGNDTGNTNGGETDGGEEVAAGDAAHGEELYNQVCIACHGEGGQGIEGLGKPFTTSEFIADQSDQELLDFIKTGRPVGHPDNTTGVDMPPKGGNPALTDEDILDIIAYIRTVQE